MHEEDGTQEQAAAVEQNQAVEQKEKKKVAGRVDPIEFRDMWNTKSISEVARHYGKTEASCRTLACNLRQRHIMCRKFPTGRKK